jgi:hypothetical protein
MKATIKIYRKNTLSIQAEFKSTEELMKWNEKHNVKADQVLVNGYLLYGWDELETFAHMPQAERITILNDNTINNTNNTNNMTQTTFSIETATREEIFTILNIFAAAGLCNEPTSKTGTSVLRKRAAKLIKENGMPDAPDQTIEVVEPQPTEEPRDGDILIPVLDDDQETMEALAEEFDDLAEAAEQVKAEKQSKQAEETPEDVDPVWTEITVEENGRIVTGIGAVDKINRQFLLDIHAVDNKASSKFIQVLFKDGTSISSKSAKGIIGNLKSR